MGGEIGGESHHKQSTGEKNASLICSPKFAVLQPVSQGMYPVQKTEGGFLTHFVRRLVIEPSRLAYWGQRLAYWGQDRCADTHAAAHISRHSADRRFFRARGFVAPRLAATEQPQRSRWSTDGCQIIPPRQQGVRTKRVHTRPFGSARMSVFLSHSVSKVQYMAYYERFPGVLLLLGCSCVFSGGCRESEPLPASEKAKETVGSITAEGASTEELETAKARPRGISVAMKAKDELFQRLSSRLVEVMAASGPANAIEVCSQEALAIAGEVGEQHGVKIGRTSFHLRNAANSPPEWAAPFVDNRSQKPEYLALADGSTGVLLPILLQPQCTVCHGDKETLAPEVSQKLAELYPTDSATGFKAGDLRGWFWIEVPAP